MHADASETWVEIEKRSVTHIPGLPEERHPLETGPHRQERNRRHRGAQSPEPPTWGQAMNPPIISVVMSVYNGQTFLAEAVNSILRQTLREFEFLVIDDGSADRTAEILADYARRDGRIRVLHHENKGRATSLNIGINLAVGGYIARMDADDIALPCRLEQQVAFMERHQEVGLLGGAIELINTTGQVLNTLRPPLSDSEIRSLMLHHNPYHPAVIMRKEVALAAGGYRKALLDAEDYDLYLRISERSQLANLDKPILQYRIHPGQVSICNTRHQALCVLAARAAASLRKRGCPDPLSGVEEVTPQLLDALGVSTDQIQQTLLNAYQYWIPLLSQTYPDAALRAIEELSHLSGFGYFERSELANAWLTAASIHYRQGRPARALVSVGRAIVVRPMIAGRPIKRASTRLATAFRSWVGVNDSNGSADRDKRL